MASEQSLFLSGDVSDSIINCLFLLLYTIRKHCPGWHKQSLFSTSSIFEFFFDFLNFHHKLFSKMSGRVTRSRAPPPIRTYAKRKAPASLNEFIGDFRTAADKAPKRIAREKRAATIAARTPEKTAQIERRRKRRALRKRMRTVQERTYDMLKNEQGIIPRTKINRLKIELQGVKKLSSHPADLEALKRIKLYRRAGYGFRKKKPNYSVAGRISSLKHYRGN